MKLFSVIQLTFANFEALYLGRFAFGCDDSTEGEIISFLICHSSFDEESMLLSITLFEWSLPAGLGDLLIDNNVSTASLSFGSSKPLLGLPAGT